MIMNGTTLPYEIRPDIPVQCSFSKDGDELTYLRNRGQSIEILPDILHCVGSTPLVRLNRLPALHNVECEVLAKCEYFNAGGSVKDRIAVRMIEDAERLGQLKPGDTLIEPTSGNTGIGLALAAAVKGYKCIIVMPEKMSLEKVDVLRALGAEIVRTPTSAGYDSAESNIAVAQKLNKQIKNSHILNQYINPNNPLAHYHGTGQEIVDACNGNIDMVVLGAGTGGTLTGVGHKIKQQVPNCTIVGVDPYGSILAQPEELNETEITYYDVEGIGYDFIPGACDRTVADLWIKTVDSESFKMARSLIREEGLLCGGSSGAIMLGAFEAIKKEGLGKDKRVVVLLPDSVRNYMTKFLSEDWMYCRGFMAHPNMILDKKRGESLCFHESWADIPVSHLKLNAPLTVDPTLSVDKTLCLLNKDGYDQVPVVKSDSSIVGMVTISRLMTMLLKGVIKSSDPVSKASYHKFNKVGITATLCELSRLLDIDHFVLVTQKQRKILPDGTEDCKEMIYGIVTKIDLVNFLMGDTS